MSTPSIIGQTPPAPDSGDVSVLKQEDACKQHLEVLPARKEIGGRGGLDPTRYGDWEKNGRCIDF